MKIYKTTYEFLRLSELCDTDAIDPQVLQDTLESISEDAETQILQIAKIIKNLDCELEAVQNEKKRLEKRMSVINNNIKFLKTSIFTSMQSMDIKKIDDPIFKISIRNNAPAVQVVDIDKIPDKYFVNTDPKLDKKKIKEDIANGCVVEGVTLASSQSLQIK